MKAAELLDQVVENQKNTQATDYSDRLASQYARKEYVSGLAKMDVHTPFST